MLYQSEARAFDGVAAWRFDDGDLAPSEAGQSAVRVRGARVTANFFDVLGVPPALGRGFAPGDDRPGAAAGGRPFAPPLAGTPARRPRCHRPADRGERRAAHDRRDHAAAFRLSRGPGGALAAAGARPGAHASRHAQSPRHRTAQARRVGRRRRGRTSRGCWPIPASRSGATPPRPDGGRRTSRPTCSRCGIRSSAPLPGCSGSCSAACCWCSSSPARMSPDCCSSVPSAGRRSSPCARLSAPVSWGCSPSA